MRAGYFVTVADPRGAIVLGDPYGDPASFNDGVGAVWDERETGTNGIGTAIVEEAAVSVFFKDHFFPSFYQRSMHFRPLFWL